MKVYHKEYKLTRGKWIDPFKPDVHWIAAKLFKKYIKERYDLEMNQVWNLTHDYLMDYHGKCEICGGSYQIT